MIAYLIKSGLCMVVLLGFYKFVLEGKPMHHFKRFFLLSGLVFALTIPLITFTYTTDEVISEPVILDYATPFVFEASDMVVTAETANSNYLPQILWGLYGCGLLLFGARFVLNLFRLKRKIKQSQKLKQPTFTLALLKQTIIPHSFLKYVFLSRKQYENHEIAPEVIAHEATHVRQKHSLDILFIEFLQVIFWFNPLFWIAKKSIKLNHEFLADQGALQGEHTIENYQNLLFSYAHDPHQVALESAFNYSLTKKRIIMLSQTFSRKRATITALILIPVLIGCVLLFNNKIVKKQETLAFAEEKWESNLTARNIDIKVVGIESYKVDGIPTNKEGLAETLASLHTDLNKKQRDQIINIHISSNGRVAYKEMLYLQKIAADYGYHRIVTPFQEIIRAKGNVPMSNHPDSENLVKWQNKYRYTIFLDNEPLPNEDILEYHPDDIMHYEEIRLNTNEEKYKVVLWTNSYWQHQISNKAQVSQTQKSGIKPHPVTSNDLGRWLDNKKYGVWLDGKRIPNSDLKNYKASFLPHYNESKLEKNAINYGKHYFQVNIMTRPYFDKEWPKVKQFVDGYAKQFVQGAARHGKKALVIEIKNNNIAINGKASSLRTFTQDIDAITKNWEEQEYTEAVPSFLFKNNSANFLKNASEQFERSHFSKANEGMKLQLPPPPPPPLRQTGQKGDTIIFAYTASREKGEVVFESTIGDPRNLEAAIRKHHAQKGVFIKDNIKISYQEALAFSKDKIENAYTINNSVTPPVLFISVQPFGKVNGKLRPYVHEAQNPVTPKEIATYNAWAKKLNAVSNKIIKMKEYEKMYAIYNRMSEAQKKTAEAFPALPPPPPPPPAPMKVKKGGKSIYPPPPPPAPKKVKKGEKSDIPKPPKPAKQPKQPKQPKAPKVKNDLLADSNQDQDYALLADNSDMDVPLFTKETVQKKPLLETTRKLLNLKSTSEKVEEHQQNNGVFFLNGNRSNYQETKAYLKEKHALRVRFDRKLSPEVLYIDAIPESIAYSPITKKDIVTYNKLAKKYNSNPTAKPSKKDLRKLYHVYASMTQEQRKEAQPYPNFDQPTQKTSSDNEGRIAYYNKLAKAYNDNPNKSVADGDIYYMQQVFKSMTSAEKSKAQPLPKQAKNSKQKKIGLVGVKGESGYNSLAMATPQSFDEKAHYYHNSAPISAAMAKKMLAENDKMKMRIKPTKSYDGESVIFLFDTPLFQPGPKPTSANIVSHIKVANRHKSTFLLNGQEISFREALKLVRNNPKLDVITTVDDTNKYQTKITK